MRKEIKFWRFWAGFYTEYEYETKKFCMHFQYYNKKARKLKEFKITFE